MCALCRELAATNKQTHKNQRKNKTNRMRKKRKKNWTRTIEIQQHLVLNVSQFDWCLSAVIESIHGSPTYATATTNLLIDCCVLMWYTNMNERAHALACTSSSAHYVCLCVSVWHNPSACTMYVYCRMAKNSLCDTEHESFDDELYCVHKIQYHVLHIGAQCPIDKFYKQSSAAQHLFHMYVITVECEWVCGNVYVPQTRIYIIK